MAPSAMLAALIHARAASTLKAYAEDWRQFVRWARDQHLEQVPADPHTVAS